MSDTNGKAKSIPEASIDTRLVFDRLKNAKPGEVIPYKELAEILGTDPRNGKGYSSVASARRMALNQLKYAFEAVSGEGIKRLTDHEASRTGEQTLKAIRRRARLGAKKLTCVEKFESLSNDDKIAHNAALSMLGAITQATSAKTQERIESAVKEATKELPVAKTLALFGGK